MFGEMHYDLALPREDAVLGILSVLSKLSPASLDKDAGDVTNVVYCFGGNKSYDHKLGHHVASELWDQSAVRTPAGISVGRRDVFVVTDDGRVNHFDSSRTEGPAHMAGFGRAKVRKLASNDEHTLAVTAEGELFSWGLDTNHQLGRPGDPKHPRRVVGLEHEHVVSASAGGYYSACVTAEGNLYTWGKGSYVDMIIIILSSPRARSALLSDARNYHTHAHSHQWHNPDHARGTRDVHSVSE